MQRIGCSISIFNDDFSKILIARRSSSKKAYPDFWETIGGSREGSESFDECILREVQEELGCAISTMQQMKTYLLFSEKVEYLIVHYIGKITGNIILKKDEISEVCWVIESELDEYNFFPLCKEKIIDSFKEHNRSPKSFI